MPTPTLKLLYGHQDGAEIRSNPIKPGRPSHVVHPYRIADVRLVLDAEVRNGKAHAARHSLPRRIELLQGLPQNPRPRLVRGDIAFGVDPVMRELETLAQPCLFKLKQSAGVKRLIERLWRHADGQDLGEGCQAAEARLTLSGWQHGRRVAVVRRAARQALAVEAQQGAQCKGRQSLQFADVDAGKLGEYAVRVTNSDDPLSAIGPLYRDRADGENGCDELQNPWGWGGCTTRDLERCNLSARAVALVYNGWGWYVRLAHPKARLEAIPSRPMLLAGVARQASHAGQSRLRVTLTHARADRVKSMIANVRKGLDTLLASAPPWTKPERWRALVRYIISKIVPVRQHQPPPSSLHPPPAPALAGGEQRKIGSFSISSSFLRHGHLPQFRVQEKLGIPLTQVTAVGHERGLGKARAGCLRPAAPGGGTAGRGRARFGG